MILKKVPFYLLTFGLLFIQAQSSFAQQKAQSFENTSADNWAFTHFPTKYVASGHLWLDTTVLNGITPVSGVRQWTMQDLDNPNGGGTFNHTLAFDAIDVSAFSVSVL